MASSDSRRTAVSRYSVSRRGSTRGVPEGTVVWVRGEQDIATKMSLTVTLARAAERDDVPLLVDLSAVTFMDASTVGAIIGCRNHLRAGGRTLEVRAPSPPALRLLELCNLTHFVHREPIEVPDAAAALGTWVDVLPIRPDGDSHQQPARVTAPATGEVDHRDP
jgi:anti-sigma B factor antagonist